MQPRLIPGIKWTRFLPAVMLLLLAAKTWADSPAITGTVAGQLNTDRTSTQCFSGVTISSTNAAVTVTIFLDVPGNGSFTNLGSFTVLDTNYVFNGTPADATTAIQGLYFVATPNPALAGSNVTTVMTIVADDTVAAVTNSDTTVITTYQDTAPTISGITQDSIDDKHTDTPFFNVAIADPNSPPQQLSISVIIADINKGSFTTLAGFTSKGGGLYTLTNVASSVTAAIQQLVFTPTPNRVVPGTYETNVFTIIADDQMEPPVTNANTTLRVLSLNDRPTLSGVTTNRNITDKQSTNVFAGFTIADVDLFATQHVTVSIVQDDSAKGVLNVGSSGFTGGPIGFSFSGTPAQATTAIQLLSFDPTENRKPIGSNEVTSFTLEVTDASNADATNTPINITVTSLSVNDPPTIANVISTNQLLQTSRSFNPYANVVIGDVDKGDYTNQDYQHIMLQATFSGTSGNGQWIAQPGYGFVSGSTYTLPFSTLSDATYAIGHLVYQAQTYAVTGTNIVSFTLVATDDHDAATTNASAGASVYTPYVPPGLSGTRSNQRVNDNATLALFSSVGVQSFNGGSFSVIIQLDSDVKGSLINLSGFTKSTSSSPASYVFNGTSEAATFAIRQLLFQPTANRIGGATTETTTFFISLVDGGVTNGPDSSTTVIVSPVNDAPTIQGISPLVTIPDNSTRAPFLTVLIGDVDELALQTNTITITLDDNAKGSFTTNSLALSGFTSNNATYTRTDAPAALTAGIRQLVFAPTPHRLPSGATENTTFAVAINDGQGGSVLNNGTVIRVAALAGGPGFSLPSPMPVSLPVAAVLEPFSSVTISDPQTVTLTLQLTNSNWGGFTSNSLASLGFTNTTVGTYTVSGSASNVTFALQNLEFAPNTNLALGAVITFLFNAVNTTGNSTPALFSMTLRLNQRSFIVTKAFDYDPNDATVTAAQKGGTLRKAIEDAGSNDHITFDLRASSPNLPDYPATISLRTNLILNKNVVIDGPGADILSISGDSNGDGNADQQLFIINAQVTINRLTLTKGYHSFSGGAAEVNAEGSLKLSYCAVTDSRADVWGGGLDVNGGTLSLDHCLVKGNATSSNFGQGGGGVSLYTDQPCEFVNTTFASNAQLAPSGLGGGALYAEDLDSGVEFDVLVLSCTFGGNRDAAGHGSSIRPNVFNTMVQVQNTIFADGQGKNLENDQSGEIVSLGGNISDDSTHTVFSIGGTPQNTSILKPPADYTNTLPSLLTLTNNGGPTLTFALGPTNVSPAGTNIAIGSAISNRVDAAFYATLGTDQRGYWRDNQPDVGAFEVNGSRRVIIEEILFAKTNNQFIEFYVPRDATALDLGNCRVLVHGQLFHTFTSQTVHPAEALVLFAANATNKTVPTGVYSQVASSSVLMDPSADTITLLSPSNQPLLKVSYVGAFVSSDPSDPGYLNLANQSLVLSPQFQGCYLPYQRVVAKEGGRVPGGTELSGAGFDASGAPLAIGNAPPRAYDDSVATDSQTDLPVVNVLGNDKDPDAADSIRVVGVGLTNGLQPGVTSLTSTSYFGATVEINASGASVGYDPRPSQFLTSLPQGSNVVDWFQYTILDSSNGVDHIRGATAGEISNNIVKATATVSINVVGVNLPPTPQDDGTNTSPALTVNEDSVLDLTTADTILANDTDPNTDDNASTLTIISIEPTNVYQNSLETVSALGAFVTLDIRYNRNETHITYDPRGSALLNSLAVGQTAQDTFYYSVMDRYGAIGTAAVHITVVGVNDRPTANTDIVATDEDTPLSIPAATLLANDLDPDTGISGPVTPHLQISLVSSLSALGATVQMVGDNVLYDPTASATLNALARKEVLVDTFTYTTTDDYGGSSNALVSVMVTGRNDTPVTAADFYSTGEKVPALISAPGVLSNDHDPDVNGVAPDDVIGVIPFAGQSALGAPVTMNADGSFAYDPRGMFDWLIQGQQTNDTFSYAAMDHSLTIANDDVFTVQSSSSSNVLAVLANDALLSQVGGGLTVNSVTTPDKAGTVAISSSGTSLIYSPSPNFVGVEKFSYVLSDGFGGTDTANVAITVTSDPLNGNLAANPDSFTVAKGTAVNLDVLANDNILPGSGATLTILSLSAPDHGGVATIAGPGPNNQISYTPNSANTFPLLESFSYIISGGGIARATGTVAVTVIDRANTLSANDDSFTVLANPANNTLDVLANDVILPGPNTNLTITAIQTNGVTGTVSINSSRARLVYRPPAGVTDHQEPVVSYTISDGAGGTGTGTVSIQVHSSGFFADDDVFSVTENSQNNSLAVLLNDAVLPNSGQTLSITDIGLGTNAPNQGGVVTINSTGKALIYTPPLDFVGEETFTYEISYGTSARAQGRVRVKVVGTMALPSNPDYYNVAKNSLGNALPVLKNDYPLPRTLLALTVTGLETNGLRGTVSISGTGLNNWLSYTPASGFIGRETFGYETSDAHGNYGTNQVSVMVGNLITRDDQFSVVSDSVNNPLDVLANDPVLPDTSTVRPISGLGTPDHGGSAGTNAMGTVVLYTPAAGFVGTEHFTYQMKDDAGGIVTGNASVSVVRVGTDRANNTVSVTIIGTNDTPTITGTRGAFEITDKQTATLFPNVTIADLDAFGLQTQAVTVTFSAPRGFLSQLGGFVQTAPGAYSMTGTPAEVTTSLRGLIYNPIENRIPVPTNEITTFTIGVTDFYVASPVVDSSTTLTVVAVNDPPTISGTLSSQRVYARLTLLPFIGVTIADVDNLGQQPVTVTVTNTSPALGYLTNLGRFVALSPGVYSLAATNPTAATAALRALIYVPTPDARLAAGGSETNRLIIAVSDGFAPTVVDSNTTIISIDPFVKKVAASDGTTRDVFAYSVSASRDLVLVGTPNDTGVGNVKSGSAYLYARNWTGTEAWGQFKKLVGLDSAASDLFGSSVGISGDTIVVGASNATTNNTHTGAAYVFERGANTWGQTNKLVPPDGAGGDQFGVSAAIHLDTIVVGAPYNKPGVNQSGAAYVYGRNQGGNGKWGLVKKLFPADGVTSDFYGTSVSINGDTILVGSPANSPQGNNNRGGAVYVYERNQSGANQWGLSRKVTAADSMNNDMFGRAVGISGDLMIVGAPFVTINNNGSGRIYLFARNQGGTNQWGQVNSFLPFDGSVSSKFGYSVTIDGELFAAGTLVDVARGGAAYVFARNYPGLPPWSPLQKLTPPTNDVYAAFGFGISLSQNTLAIGAHFDDANNNRFAETYIYRLKFDNGPYLAKPIPDQYATPDVPFTFAIPDGTFADPDVNDTLTLSLSFSPAPPVWLNFSPATATFSGTPDTVGTFPVVVRATDQDGASASATFNLIVGNPTFVLRTAHIAWRESYFGADVVADPSLEATVWGENADPDGDGVVNIQEYVFGSNPLSADAGDATPVHISANANDSSVLLTYKRRTDDWRIAYSLQVSGALESWQAVDPALVLSETSVVAGLGVEQVTQEVLVPPAVPQFFRVRVLFLAPE